MIKYEDGEIEISCGDVSEVMQESSMLIMGVLRNIGETLGDEVPLDFLVTDLFKSLRYAALMEDGKTEEETLAILNGTETKPSIDLG